MGKAAVELPDPLQTPADAGKPLTSTDDLLAQLAGEEIDRLLAEVDDQSAAMPAPAAPRPDPSHPIELSGTPEPEPSPSTPHPKVEDEAPATVEAAVAAVQPDLTAELDAFFKTAVKPGPLGEQAPADVVETSTAERAGLNAPLADPAAGSAAARNVPGFAAGTESATDDAPLPAYLKPLEWINAPMHACPSGLRDFIGKAAIITLVNAAAVLAYVMLFRRH